MDTSGSKHFFFHRRRNKIILIILAILIAVRIALPYIALNYANRVLANLKGYSGHIRDIDMALYRGAYVVKDFYLHKKDTVTNTETDFFDSRISDISIQWKELFHGRIVGEIGLDYPNLIFTRKKVEPAMVLKDSAYLQKLFDRFMPLKVNRFEVTNGSIHYIDKGIKPGLDIHVDDTHIIGENLESVRDTALLPATIYTSADVYGGSLNFNMKLDPLAEQTTFDLNAALKNTSLPKLNSFFKAYGKFDVNRGNFGLYTEIAAAQGKFIGYVKPVIKDLDVLGPEDANDPLLQKFWEGLVGTAGVILRNQKHDQVATKVPMQGTFKSSRISLWIAVLELLSNAFVQALQPAIDNEITIGSVKKVAAEEDKKKKGFFNKLFGPKDKKEKKKKRTAN